MRGGEASMSEGKPAEGTNPASAEPKGAETDSSLARLMSRACNTSADCPQAAAASRDDAVVRFAVPQPLAPFAPVSRETDRVEVANPAMGDVTTIDVSQPIVQEGIRYEGGFVDLTQPLVRRGVT